MKVELNENNQITSEISKEEMAVLADFGEFITKTCDIMLLHSEIPCKRCPLHAICHDGIECEALRELGKRLAERR